jgi:hypothetical protein
VHPFITQNDPKKRRSTSVKPPAQFSHNTLLVMNCLNSEGFFFVNGRICAGQKSENGVALTSSGSHAHFEPK